MAVQAVLFDMDGVLIDARDWHYRALNDALDLFGMAISPDEHLSTYDGLPTRRKLDLLSATRGLPRRLHPFIHALKQRRTLEITYESCRPLYHHQYALARLHREGFRLAVCSNSVRRTVDAMMAQAALVEYLEFSLSNEDVARPKPDPEMYLAAMRRMNLSPEACLIVEDNDHGLQAARASGAHVMEVGGVFDVTYERLRREIDLRGGAA
jgi:beta-phosphoglucomutase